MLSYISLNKLAGRPVTLTALMIAAAIGIFGWGAPTDRTGPRPVYLFGCAPSGGSGTHHDPQRW
jgi:MFS family permease